MKRNYKGDYRSLSALKSRHVLITGSTGHIGSSLITKLAPEAVHLLLVARDEEKLDQLKKPRSASNIEVFPCDLTQAQDVSRLRKHIGNIDFLVHLASYVPKVSAVQDDALVSVQNNVVATANVLDHFGSSVRKVCLASTAEVYGLTKYLPIDESHPTEPQTYYGAGKLAAEKYAKVFSERHNCPTVILRFASVYGPGETIQRAIPNFIRAALKGSSPVIYGEGLDLRDYVYIDDAVESIVLALQGEISGCKVYNIASGQGYAIKEVAKMIVNLCKGMQPLVYQPATRQKLDYVFDISAAQRDLQYSPKISLEEGLRHEIAWFQSQVTTP
jgi:UDP-glucose 4-epimerase